MSATPVAISSPATQRTPILVTGVPRSGTTWLARLLAAAPGTALAGREPMNPHRGQYALGRSLSGWTRLDEPTPRQRRSLRLAYAGVNPWVYSRYGRRQWAAVLPSTRVVVKDPFAMLSVPAIEQTVAATTVLVYRHPGAVLASYRRMGWEPDLAELAPVLDSFAADAGAEDTPRLPAPGTVGPAEAMSHFWNALYGMALFDLARTSNVVVVSHGELAAGGGDAAKKLFAALALPWTDGVEKELLPPAKRRPAAVEDGGHNLHNFDRDPVEVASSWRASLDPEDLMTIERETAAVQAQLASVRLPLS